MRVRDLMHVRPVTTEADTPICEVARLMKEFRCGEIPVTEDSRLVGVVTDRDITCRAVAEARDPLTTRVREIMTRRPARIRQDEPLRHAIRLMEDLQVRRLPVVNGDGSVVVGIISMTDICLRASRGTTGELLREVSRHREEAAHQERGPEVFPPYF